MSNLEVLVCSPRQLLAMKLFSARLDEQYQDLPDTLFLCRELRLTTKEELFKVLFEYIKRESVESKNLDMRTRNSINTFVNVVYQELIL
jgi:hypothetical protein